MKKYLLIFIMIFICSPSFSQGNEEALPISWSKNFQSQHKKGITPIELPPIDLEAVIAEDSINDLDKSLPWRYGIVRPIILDLANDGEWTQLNSGGRIWRIAIKSPQAINLSVNFNDFRLPIGSRLHLYNEDQSEVSRTYSFSENTPDKKLGSWFVSGDVILVEYYEPSSVSESPDLIIGSVIHGYRMGRVRQFVNRGLNDSGACNYDVNCPVGNDFDNKKELVKKAVALLNLGNGYLCSSSLINTTLNDKTPYLLTANHCLQYGDPSLWSVRFNWMSPSPICATEEESLDIQTNFTMSGAILRANNEISDFALVELVNNIPPSWDVAFAGWDNTDNLPEFEIGIHHPNGDIMKISRDDTGAVKENANGTEVWLIGGTSVGYGDGWEIGTTESGSSGSPLFNEEGRIIGQLYAGQSACDGIQNNNDYDIYGRLGVSWNYGDSAQNRLLDWLDPNGTGQSTTETLQNILNTEDFEEYGSLDIYPNPASSSISIINGMYPNLEYKFYNILGQNILQGSVSNTINEINVSNINEGVYFLYLKDTKSNIDITKKIIIER